MKKNKTQKINILALINIIISIIFLSILSLSIISDNVIYFMIMTLLVGWAIPYFVLIITGISIIKEHRPKLCLIFNITNLIITILFLVLCLKSYDKYIIVFIVEYSIIILLSLINTIYFRLYLKNHPNPETERIKKAKKENNGAIV